jgi:hypothetical protein
VAPSNGYQPIQMLIRVNRGVRRHFN